eukprot:CAMPEP_0204245190 /NCGR_PEP_ID=MMETSP0361-20130328/97481_1 /ASSEMBLY_ACC=CAM_ASM_000343 /TAXON_ID=268821 /ORGANISM="Scrippsiella Hangoei, Strain SHTV-5" /LENGTH=109 /DNA_ID=CAMNT_0051218369 /DNA_START=173 /DNA_END=498 /DNA_ORIENTATION=+
MAELALLLPSLAYNTSSSSHDGRAGALVALLRVEYVLLLGVIVVDAGVEGVRVALRREHASAHIGLVGAVLVLLGPQVRDPKGRPRHSEQDADCDHREAHAIPGAVAGL